MNCALTTEQQEQFFGKVYKDLKNKAASEEAFVLNDYIKDVYDLVLKATEDDALALTYAQLTPEFVDLALTGKRDLIRSLRDKGLSRDNLEDTIELFEDIVNVEDIVLDKITESDINETVESVKHDSEKLERPEPPTEEAQVKAESEGIPFIGQPDNVFTSTGQEGTNIDGQFFDDKNPEEKFYYEFFDAITEAMRNQASTPEEVTINGHTGFKLKIISKTQLPIDKARLDEQELYNNTEEVRDGKSGKDLYDEGIGVFVTDLEGNILNFDQDYNIDPDGKPIYHNLRKPILENGEYVLKAAKLQSIEDVVRNKARILFPSMSFTQFKMNMRFQYDDLVSRTKKERQTQLETLYNMREFLKSNPEQSFSADITDVSIGILPIDEGASTDVASIDWANSDINYSITINDTEGGLPGLGEAQGGVYIRIPGYRSIPLQRKNIEAKHIQAINALLFDNIKMNKDGMEVDITPSQRKDLIESILITNKDSIQFFVNNEEGTYKVNVKGKTINMTDAEAIETAKAQVKEILSTPYKPGSRFNNKYGQYRIAKPKVGNTVVDFSVEEGILKTETLSLDDYVARYATMKVKPAKSATGENNKLSFLNGYFGFEVSLEDLNKLNKQEETKEITPETRSILGRSIASDDSLYADRFISMDNTKEEIAKAKEWFNKSPLRDHIGFEELFNVINSNAWAEFSDGTIKLYAGSNHTVLYHEAWHAFSQHFLSKEEQQKLYEQMLRTKEGKQAVKDLEKKKGRELNRSEKFLAIEEMIAEDFRQYMLSDGKSKLLNPKAKGIFARIVDFLKALLGKLTNITPEATNITLEEMYSNLRVGKLNHYSPSEKNAHFKDSALYSKYEPVSGKESSINDQDALLLSETMDSIMAMIIDEQNELNGNTKFTSALFTQPGKFLHPVYEGVKQVLEQRKSDLIAYSNEVEGIELKRVLKNIELLTDAIDNFGLNEKVQASEGLVAYHLNKSLFLEGLEEDSFAVKREDFKNIEEQSDIQVKYLIKSLKNYKGGKEEVNKLGFPKLTPYNTSWKKLMNILSGNNGSPKEMYDALASAALTEPWVQDLLNRLGPVDTKFHSTFDLWTAFWTSFNFAKQPLFQVSVVEVKDSEGKSTFEVKVGQASAVFRQVERDFNSYFKTVRNHPFIIDTKKYGNKLDYDVLAKYKNKINTVDQKFKFLKDIGIPLTKNIATIKGLESVRVDMIYNKLKTLADNKIPVTNILKALRDTYELETPTGPLVIKSESSNINSILNLEARNSGQYANIGVSTPEGNTKYEEVMMSSLGNIARELNTVDTFDELIAKPHMYHLSYEMNPNITSSSMMKSLFEFNEVTQRFGKRKPGIQFTITDMGGTQNITEDSADYGYSVTTAKSDGYTRLLQDIYSGLMLGKFTNITPSDKSTILSTTVSELDSGINSKSKSLYVDIADFNKKGYKHTQAIHSAYELLLPYLGGELARIAKVKEYQKTGIGLANIPGYTTPDSKGNLRGVELTIFDDILKTVDGLTERVLEAGSIEKIKADPELQQDILDSLNLYFKWSSQQTRKTLGERMMFADKNITDKINSEVGKALPKDKIEDIMIKAYTVNSFIHHVENFNILYGDLAQYKDISKRNYGIQSTGNMFRTDEEAYKYVNQVLGRPFEAKFKGEETNRSFDGTLNTVIFKENTVSSKLTNHYREELTKFYTDQLKKEGLKGDVLNTQVEAIVNTAMGPYEKMDEGDAQAWINFDTYRILAKLNNTWTMEQESLFLQMLNDPESVQFDKIAEYFPPRKYQYFGPVATEGLGATAFHKYSLFPLIPTAIKGTNLEALQETMFKQGIDYATFDSGSKVSTITAQPKLEERKKINEIAKKLKNKQNITEKERKLLNKYTSGDILYSDLENRIFKERTDAPKDQLVKNTIYIQYLKDQLKINSHYKGKVIFSTQLRTLIEEGLLENGLPIDFMPEAGLKEREEAWGKLSEKEKFKQSEFYSKFKTYENKISKLIELRKAQLKNEIGWGENETADLSKLVSFIRTELSRQDLADHELDFIKIDSEGKMVYDLSVSPSAAKIERALNAIVNNRLVRQKVNGEALVQLASTLMEPRKATEVEKREFTTNDLQSYRRDPETGKTLPMDVKVAMQGKFKYLVHMLHKDGKKIQVFTKREYQTLDGKTKFIKEVNQAETLKRLNETIKDPEWRKENINLITMVGVRIPVQGLNSMENMAVWEFLPEETGNVIIPPSEMVAKSGSDFDIDKLTVIMPSISLIGGKPILITDIDNGNTNKQNIERVENIKSELKDLKKKKNEIQKKYNEEFKDLGKGELSAEDELLKQQEFEYYTEELSKLNKEIRDLEFNNERLWNYEKLTQKQEELQEQVMNDLEAADERKEILEEEFKEVRRAFGSKQYQKALTAFEKKRDAELKPVLEKIEQLQIESEQLGDTAIQNSLMIGIKDILELPSNFVSLITPNDTSLFTDKGGIVEELSGNREYDSRNGVKGSYKSMSPTRVLEPSYNVDVHSRNSVGKQVLGLGANANVFNVLLNRIGMKLNSEYKTRKGEPRRAELLLDHHKDNGQISLSNIYGLDGIKIADVINQLMNGWVDVAKDAWIFDIQGNLEVTPSLLFLIMSGVPYKQAIYFVSNPIIKEYVKEQKLAKSAFAKATGEAAEEKAFAINKAKYEVLKKLGFRKMLDMTKKRVKSNKLYESTLNMTEKAKLDQNAKRISKLSFEEATDDFNAKAGFLHYLEIEELAKKLEQFRRAVKLDTARNTTLFDAQVKEADIRVLSEDTLFDTQYLNKAFEETATGKFRIGPFQTEIWNNLFELRNHPAINEFLIARLSNIKDIKIMNKMYNNNEKFVEEFKNDFIVSLYTEAIKNLDLKSGQYKGLDILESVPTELVKQINRGVVVDKTESGQYKIYIDKGTLDLQFNKSLFSPQKKKKGIMAKVQDEYSYEALGLATLPVAAFRHGIEKRKDEFYKFVIEREYQRAMNPFSEVSKTKYFKHKVKVVQRSLEFLENESTEDFGKRVMQVAYEEILRDRALNNTMNFWKLFMSGNTIADEIFELKELNPSLEEDYNVIQDFIISEGTQLNDKKEVIKSVKNLALRDNRVSTDELEIYYQNIMDLMDPSTNSIPISEDSIEEDYAENKRIAELFRTLAYASFFQSGLTATDKLSLIRIMPQNVIGDMVNSIKEKVLNDLNSDPSIISNYSYMFSRQNKISNIAFRRRLKNYVKTDQIENPTRSIVNSDIEASHRMPMNFTDGDSGRKMRSEFKGKSTFDLILSGDRTATSRSPQAKQGVKKGDVIEFTKTVYNSKNEYSHEKSVLVRATSDEYSLDSVTAEEWSKLEGWDKSRYEKLRKQDYVQFTFELMDIDELTPENEISKIDPDSKEDLESLIKNNPSAIFVLEGAVNDDGFYVPGIGKVSSYDNVMPVITRIENNSNKQSLFTDETIEETAVYMQESIEKIKQLMDESDSKVVFLSNTKGYGSYLYGTQSFDFLSAELYEKFGYQNAFSKITDSVQEMIKNEQSFNEYDIAIPMEELIEAEDRLKCNN